MAEPLESLSHGAVRELRLARPPANALDPTLIRALRDAVLRAPEEGAKAIVISGREGMFSAGLDVPVLLGLDRAAMVQVWRDFFGLLEAVARSRVPVIAALTGHSPAGGAVLSIYCDYRIMAAGKFRIGLNETQVGLPLPEVIYQALRFVVGARQAERLGVAGLLVTPEEALRVGLVDEVVAPAEVVPRAIAYAEKLAAVPPLAMADAREVARADLHHAFDGLAREFDVWVDRWFSPETQAAMRALLQRLAK